jgi:hypothetical protein|tara:strand:- start:610 stop:873 length:264 start_codon:yes stop_codon:yes gene_type:complete
MSAAAKECTGCGLPLQAEEIWMDNTGSVVINEKALTTGEVLCEYCFDNAYPVGSAPDDDDRDPLEKMDDMDDIEYFGENWYKRMSQL